MLLLSLPFVLLLHDRLALLPQLLRVFHLSYSSRSFTKFLVRSLDYFFVLKFTIDSI